MVHCRGARDMATCWVLAKSQQGMEIWILEASGIIGQHRSHVQAQVSCMAHLSGGGQLCDRDSNHSIHLTHPQRCQLLGNHIIPRGPTATVTCALPWAPSMSLKCACAAVNQAEVNCIGVVIKPCMQQLLICKCQLMAEAANSKNASHAQCYA